MRDAEREAAMDAALDAGAQCRSDRECSAQGGVCDRTQGTCVECVTRVDCPGDGSVCERGRCRAVTACTTSRQCPGQVCSTAAGYCVDCVGDNDCAESERCVEGTCAPRPRPCASSRQCSDLALVCDLGLGACVECVGDNDCEAGSVCRANRCVRRVCAPGESSCDGAGARFVCNGDGTARERVACGANESCSEGACRARVCTPGMSGCMGAGARGVCSDDGLRVDTVACEAGTSCRAGACVARVCAPGASECVDASTRRVCDADGLGFTASACAASERCVMGACAPRPVGPEFTRCTDASTCAGPAARCDVSFPGGSCTVTCETSSACGAGAMCVRERGQCYRACTVGGRQCGETEVCLSYDGAARVCLPACGGTGAVACNAGVSCDPYSNVCRAEGPATAGADNGAPCAGDAECRSGNCVEETNAETGAPTGFVGGYCVSFGRYTGEIRPGQPLPRGTCPVGSVGVPTDVGAGAGDSAACFDGCLTNAECRAGYECDNRLFDSGTQPTSGFCSPINCLAAPHSTAPNANCPAGYACEAQTPAGGGAAVGVCTRRVCAPGASECVDANTRRVCNADGRGFTTSACTGGQTCLRGACVTNVCAPSSVSCADATTRRVCNADGTAQTDTPCALGQVCSAGACVARVCTAGASECVDASTRRVCNADGLGFTTSGCDASSACVAGACRARVCTPGEASCGDASTRRVCNADGFGYTSAACPAGQTCGGAGVCSVATAASSYLLIGHGDGANPKRFAVSRSEAREGTWTSGTIGAADDTSLVRSPLRAFRGRYWFASSDRRVWTSSDGSTWARSAVLSHDVTDLIEGPTGVFALSGTTASSHTGDGVSWSARTLPIAARAGVALGGRWLLVDLGTQAAVSTNGTDWTARGTGGAAGTVVSIASCGASSGALVVRWAAMNRASVVRTSDGLSWTDVAQGSPSVGLESFNDVACFDGTYSVIGVQPGYTTTQLTSTDGGTWTAYQPYTGYNPSIQYNPVFQGWDSVGRVSIVAGPVPGSWTAESANSYYRATRVGGGWTRLVVNGSPFSAARNGIFGAALLP